MKSDNNPSVLCICALTWISLCGALSFNNGGSLKSFPKWNIGDVTPNENFVKKVPRILNRDDIHERGSWNTKYKGVLHVSKNEGKIKDGRRGADGHLNVLGRENYALKYSPQTRRRKGRKVFLTKSVGWEYDDSIFPNKDLVTRTQQKSIPQLQFARTSGHEDVKDLTLLYGRDPLRDTYRGRYHKTRTEDGPRLFSPSSAGRKSFDSVNGRYKSRGSLKVIDGWRGVKIDNASYYGHVFGGNGQNLIVKSRTKRSEKEGISRYTDNSQSDKLTLNTSHSDQNSWPDKIHRSDNKQTSLLDTTTAPPPFNVVTNASQTNDVKVSSSTIEPSFHKPSSSIIIPKETFNTIPTKRDLTSSARTNLTDSTTLPEQATTERSKPSESQQPVSHVSTGKSSVQTGISGKVDTTVPGTKVTGTTTPVFMNDDPSIVLPDFLDTLTTVRHEQTSVPNKSPTKSGEITNLKADQLSTKQSITTEKNTPSISKPISEPENSTLLDDDSNPVPAAEEITEPESVPETSSLPSEEPAVLVTAKSINTHVEPSSKPEPESTPVKTPASTPEPTTESEPATEPSTNTSTEPATEPSTNTSPEPEPEKTFEPSTVVATKFTGKTFPEPTAKTLYKETLSSLSNSSTLKTTPKATTSPSAEPTTLTTAEPTTEPTPEPTTEPSPEPTTKTLQTSKVTVKQKTHPSPEPTSVPETSAETFWTLKTGIPVILPEADETFPDQITKISNSSNNSNSTDLSGETNTTKLSTTAGDSAQTEPETKPSSASSQSPPISEPVPTPSSEPASSPSSEPASSPSSEPSSTYEPEPEPGQPESESSTTNVPSGSTPLSVAEPGPDWEDAKKKWSIAWEIHLYMLGGIFAAIAFYSLTSMVKLYQINRLLSKKYFITLNLLIFVLCTLRAVFLLVDGYNANNTFHPVTNYLLYSTAFPCLTSAFSILLYALLQATQMRLVPPRVQKIQILIVIIFFHFVLQITTDIVVGTYAGMKIMLFVCQMVFICWGLFLFFGYAYVFRYLYSSAVKRQKNYQYMLTGKLYPSGGESYKHKFTLSLAVKVTFMAAILGLVTIGLEIYAIVGVYGVFSDKKPEAWPWWLYHTALRLMECLMCIIMAYVASQPFRYREVKSCGFMCAPCLEICKCGSKDEQSDKLGWSEYDRLYMTTNKRSNGHTNGKKKKIYLNEGTDIVPIVIQPSTTQDSRPPSMLIIEDGYVRFQAETDINKMVDNYAKTHNDTEMTTFGNYDGIVNGAYIRSMEDTVRFQDDVASSDGFTRKSRKSSLASSGFFRPPSSISLADSMESEIDKAFRSMRQDSRNKLCASTHSLPSRSTYSMDENFQGPAIEAYLEQVAGQPGVSLRRSRSALGDLNIHRPESWRQKLFRSRSDSTGGVRTKDLDSMRYLSLLDLEKQQEKTVTFANGTAGSKDLDNSDDSSSVDNQSRDSRTSRDVVKRLLQKENSEPEEIDV